MSITADYVRSIVHYDPLTGKFFWKERSASHFQACKFSAQGKANRWNGRFLGKEAGKHNGATGRVNILIDGQTLAAGRVAWVILHWVWPLGEIDHINGDPSDNRAHNLRDVIPAQNCWNTKTRVTNKIGLKGVVFHSQIGRWRATITAHGKRHSLGCYETPEEAHAAYCGASKVLHGEYGRVR